MVSRKLLGVAALLSLAYAQNQNGGNGGSNNGGSNNNNGGSNGGSNSASNNGADSTQLLPNAIQTGSFFDGSQGLGAEDGQALSQTSKNNFINLCAGQTITNGLQVLGGSCSPTPQGFIPAKDKMVSSIILSPQNGQTIEPGKDFNISVQVNGLEAGSFTNADATYYSAPQALNSAGNVIGHTHVTVQDLGNSLNPKTPLDPTQFAFFKGINDAGNGNGLLQAVVAGGLPSGNFRLCTMTSASNHQPVIMPVAQRGSQDDCTKFTVSGNDNTINNAANDGSGGEAAAAAAASAVAIGPGAVTGATAAAQQTGNAGNQNGGANKGSSNNNQGNKGNQGNQGNQGGSAQGGKSQRLVRFAVREFVA